MIVIVAGKTVKGPVTVTISGDDPESVHSVAPISRAEGA